MDNAVEAKFSGDFKLLSRPSFGLASQRSPSAPITVLLVGPALYGVSRRGGPFGPPFIAMKLLAEVPAAVFATEPGSRLTDEAIAPGIPVIVAVTVIVTVAVIVTVTVIVCI